MRGKIKGVGLAMERHKDRRYHTVVIETLRLWEPQCGSIWEEGRK
jgi:hypothetical protein